MTADGALIPPLPGASSPGPAGRPPAPRRRCARHEDREAVARCVVCGGGFCRECVTEHDDRLYCAPCFARETEARRRTSGQGASRWRGVGAAARAAGSVLCVVVGIYLVGRLLAAIPPELHEGTVWKDTFAP